jgi:outer membrane protein assembly factor BamB
MSATATAAPTKRLSFLRVWLPLLVLILAAAGGAGVWFWPSDGDNGQRTFTVISIGLLAAVLLALWLLLLSGFRWWLRVGPVVLAVAAFFGLFRPVPAGFTGDMVPIFAFRWASPHGHRAGAAAPGAVPLGAAGADDFPAYRGRRRDGDAGGPALLTDWKAQPPREVWRQPAGGGYAGFAVARGVAVTIEQDRDHEAVVCYDAGSGREYWAYSYEAFFSEKMGGDGPRATPAIAGDSVFSLGAKGKLVCLDLATGQLRWEADVLRDNANLRWGMAGSPLVDEKRVIVSPGVQAPKAKRRALIAYDRATGQELWASGDHRGAYSSPMFADLCGRPHVLVFDGDGLTGYDAADGRELWHHPWITPPEYINVAQPLVLDGDRVFISSGYGVGCAMLRVKKESGGKFAAPEVLWQNKHMKCKFTSPVHHDGFLYGLDDGILACLDAKTGAQRWEGDRYYHGQVLLSNGLLVVLSEKGKLVLVEAAPEKFRELARLDALSGPKTWNPFALSAGRAYLRNHEEMACYDLPRAEPR